MDKPPRRQAKEKLLPLALPTSHQKNQNELFNKK